MKPTKSSKTPKVILDTNVILSAVLFGGNSLKLLDATQKKRFTLCISEKLVEEVFDKLINKFHVDEKILDKVGALLVLGKVYTPSFHVNFPKDPEDAYLLELAEESTADYLVTGDKKHLLPLRSWKSTTIISPHEAVNIFISG